MQLGADKKKNGFTLVELLVVLGIIGMVSAAVGTFFIPNLKAFNNADNQIEVQQQAQNAINMLVDKAMGSKGISVISDTSGSSILSQAYSDAAIGPEIGGITFDTDIANAASKLQAFKREGSKLLYAQGSSEPLVYKDAAACIEHLKIVPIPSGCSFQTAAGIKLEVTAAKGSGQDKTSVTLKNEVYFRNKAK